MDTFKKLLPGLILVSIVGLLGKLATGVIPNIGAVALAIIIGIIVGNLLRKDEPFVAGIQYAEKKILPIAIMCLGVQLQLQMLLDLGLPMILLVITVVFITLGVGVLIGRMLGMSKEYSLLMGTGNAVCGSSAIAAVSPIVKGKETEIGLSIGVVNLLGTLGIFIMPFVASSLSFGDIKSGALIGGTLQAVGQVVAAGYAVNDYVGNIAVLVKMGRVMMLGPVVLILSYLMLRGEGGSGDRVKIPFFIFGFFAFSLIASFELLPANILDYIKDVGKVLLIVAMAAIGMKIKFASLLKFGPQAVLFGSLIAVVQIIFAILFVLFVFQ